MQFQADSTTAFRQQPWRNFWIRIGVVEDPEVCCPPGEAGKLLDESFVGRTAKFLDELIWMSRVLRYGRENIAPA